MGRKDRDVEELRRAVQVGLTGASGPTLVESVMQQVFKLPAFQEHRTLRWKFKQMSKASGKQGATIYELKCQIAELRGLMDAKERAGARSERDADTDNLGMQAAIVLQDEQIQRLTTQLDYQDTAINLMRAENAKRLSRIEELEAQLELANAAVAGLESKLALARQVRDNSYPYSPWFPSRLPADVPPVTWNPSTLGPVIGQAENDQVSA